MSYSVELRQVPAQSIATLRGPTTAANLPISIGALFDKFYAGFKGKAGLNIAYYPSWSETSEFEIECGVQVETGGNSSTPAGTVLTTSHIGPHNQMKSAHHAIHHWARDNGRKLAGPSWEVYYGNWSDDPAKLRTDIFYLVA